MIRVNFRGRLGNRLIQYAAGYILAKKTGLEFNTSGACSYGNSDIDDFQVAFKIPSIDGTRYTETTQVTDDNFLDYLKTPKEGLGYELTGYFFHDELLGDYRADILEMYQFVPPAAPSHDDVFIHARYGDTINILDGYCSVQYIEKQLQQYPTSSKIYVSSDTIDHPPLVNLIKKYNLIEYHNTPLNTILFASCFNNMILSAGTFSYWIMYLGDAENVHIYDVFYDESLKHGAYKYNKRIIFDK